jgi:hypothetical protein
MLEKVRDTLNLGTAPERSVAKMLLEDDQEGLTKREYRSGTAAQLYRKQVNII